MLSLRPWETPKPRELSAAYSVLITEYSVPNTEYYVPGTIRNVALPLGLVDVKVCAVDATWSGLKLVIRKELRK